ncbi:NAD(P)-dependent oxidoreductase [Rhodococcus rhodnii]|uniref:NAD(P)-dependent oxidoreductase n=2 Tax=Rhodococcus rhodnii TaxID=38312 RepID=A0A6P2CKS6_9NOCA|nr:NAD(P)-dependent oxidoreductase [Rhodococcus rhodnii]
MGRSHCRTLAEQGADILAFDLPGADLTGLRSEIEVLGRRCTTAEVDVCDREAMATAVTSGTAELGPLTAVVANAGVYETPGPGWTVTPEQWQRSLDVNLTGIWNTVSAAEPHLADGGSVVLVSSTAGVKAIANAAPYSAAKHAVVGLARTLANELGQRGIRVNSVHPGSVRTPMIINPRVFARLCPDVENPTEEDAARVLAARNILPVPWVDPVDVSNAVAFLVSGESRYMTGTRLVVDAGLTEKV